MPTAWIAGNLAGNSSINLLQLRNTDMPTQFPTYFSSLLRWCTIRIAACFAMALLTVAGNASAQTANLVGFWYKPSESGWGLSIQQQGTRTFAVWFTYNAQSKPVWYTLDCAFTGTTCAGTIATATGTPLSQMTGSANLVATAAGTGSLVVTGNNRLTLNYTIGNVTQSKANLEPQNFAAADQVPVCTLQAVSSRSNLTNYTDHWWGGTAAQGWGMQISHQANIVFLGWYVYDAQGSATWYTAQGTQDAANARRITGSIYQVTTGIPFSQINGPISQASIITAGTFELNFADGERGTFSYTIPALGITNRSLAIERFAIAGGPVNVCTTSSAPVVAKTEAARFLGQATFGPRMSEIDDVASRGYDAWLDSQFAKPQSLHLPAVTAYLNTLPVAQQNGQTAFQWSIWKNFATGDDALRQRVAFALSEIFVVSNVSNIAFAYPRGPAQYLDTLGANAFGNFRSLLEAVTYSPMMGIYLSHLHNVKENPATGQVPDENYAREVMQLFTIGLYVLNNDGSIARDPIGRSVETYSNSDVSGLAKVFTGLSWAGPDTTDNRFNGRTPDPNREILPMQAYNQFHSISQKQFLGTTIPPSTTASVNTNNEVRIALDTLFNHQNVGPFFGKQLIQKLVTSNPSAAYVSRVSAAFNNNGSGVRGDMKAVIKAVLLDPEARAAPGSIATSGKLREPVVRFVHWMRSFNARSNDGRFILGTLLDPASQLAESPMYSPSVFNFFRPGYSPSNSRVGNTGLVAPEAQIINETSIAGYLNFMRSAISTGVGTSVLGVRDIQPDYTAELALAANPDALVDRVGLLLTGNSLSATTRTRIRDAVATVTIGTANPANDQRNRVNLAIFLTMASPEYIFQN
jgi:uncharacterized protein (DUF1800 family)